MQERIGHRQPSLEHLSILHVLGIKGVAAGGQGCSHDQGIPVADLIAFAHVHGLQRDLGGYRYDFATAQEYLAQSIGGRPVYPALAQSNTLRNSLTTWTLITGRRRRISKQRWRLSESSFNE